MRIDVPTEFATCVRRLDGVVLDDVLQNPAFFNADYWFPAERVVGELKCLSENLAAQHQFNDLVESMYASWIKRRLIPRPVSFPVQVNLRDLPLRCAREFIDPVKKRLESSAMKKANKQIRDTKKHLNAADAKGLLILVNDGNYLLPPTMMVHLLARTLKQQYRSIDSVIYFSVNESSSVPGNPMPSLFWIDAIPPGRTAISSDLRERLRATWMAHHSSLVPGPIFEIECKADPDFVDNIQFTAGAA